MTARTSIIWQPSQKEFQKMVDSTRSKAELIRAFGLIPSGSQYKILNRRLSEDKPETSHWIKYRIPSPLEKRPLKEVMTRNSSYSRRSLKKRIIKNKLIPYKCTLCGLPPKWEKEPLVLVLDHINGVSNDHRKKNLRFLCPNCNSQQSTFAGRNRKGYVPNHCVGCGEKIHRKSTWCIPCSNNLPRRKEHEPRIEWPSTEEILKSLLKISFVGLGKKLGVSDNAIRKRIKAHPSETPVPEICNTCGKKLPKGVVKCIRCISGRKRKPIQWPLIEDLVKEVSKTSAATVARKLGCDRGTVRKKILEYKKHRQGESNSRVDIESVVS